jgi:hypothetical protein
VFRVAEILGVDVDGLLLRQIGRIEADVLREQNRRDKDKRG